MFPYQPPRDPGSAHPSASADGQDSQEQEDENALYIQQPPPAKYVYPTAKIKQQREAATATPIVPETFSQISNITDSILPYYHGKEEEEESNSSSSADWQISAVTEMHTISGGTITDSQIVVNDDVLLELEQRDRTTSLERSRWDNNIVEQRGTKTTQHRLPPVTAAWHRFKNCCPAVNRKKKVLWVGLVVTAVLVVLVGGICGSGNCGSKTSGPISTVPKSRAEAILFYINSITLAGRTLRYPSSHPDVIAEERALQWLIDDDLNTTASDERSLRQRYALATVMFQNYGPVTSTLQDSVWVNLSASECEWLNIDCVDGEVTRAFFRRLTGPIPSDLGLLTDLTYLDLQSSQLTGTIPSALGDLSKLTGLYLDRNQLTGTIPPSLGSSLTNLVGLWIYNNALTGSVPFCQDNATSRFASFGLYTGLHADCDQLDCSCCTRCCPLGGWNGIPQASTLCES
jgi:hypothetical protein